MWFKESNIYQIYPLGMCGCPWQNPGEPADHDLTSGEGAGEALPFTEHRIGAVENYIEHIKGLGCDTVLFNPLFESDAHGYDTRNMRLLDRRLGTNEDLKHVCRRLREAGLRVMFDGVFNHVGRGFFGFQDVLKNREHSPYLRWFHIDLWGNSPYHDGLSYEAWEGCYYLVKLNLGEPEVRRYIFDSIRYWYEEFGISGLRLDVAYCLDRDFLRELRSFTRTLCDDFFLFGDLFGRKNRVKNDIRQQFGRFSQIAFERGGMDNGLFLGGVGIQFAPQVFQPAIDMKRFAVVRSLEKGVFEQMGQSMLTFQLVPTAGIDRQGTMRDGRAYLFVQAADAVGEYVSCKFFHGDGS